MEIKIYRCTDGKLDATSGPLGRALKVFAVIEISDEPPTERELELVRAAFYAGAQHEQEEPNAQFYFTLGEPHVLGFKERGG